MPETSSLRTAIDKIMGWPAATTTTPAPGGVAPRGDVVNLGTGVTLENEVPPPAPDPYADELAALQASNAELAAQLGGGTAAAAVPEDTLGKGYGLSYSYPNSGFGSDTYKVLYQGATPSSGNIYDPEDWMTLTAENINDPWVQESMAGGLVNLQDNTSKMAVNDSTNNAYNSQNKAIGAWESLIANPSLLSSSAYAPKSSSGSSTLRNPGPKAPWQESQQYWKDLAAQTGK